MSQELCIKFPMPQHNEMTSCPVWFVIDPYFEPEEGLTVRDVSCMFDGPFFSREEATEYLETNGYNHSKRATVYCKSGNVSPRYRAAFQAPPTA